MNDSTNKEPMKIGDKMEDGTVYAGISPDTGRAMYAAPADVHFGDARARLSLGKAKWCAKQFQLGGKDDFRIPSWRELNELFKSKDEGALKGTFNTAGKDHRGSWYTSSSTDHVLAVWQQRFSDGAVNNYDKFDVSSVRLVRG
ncbi:MAG: hypothetical protein ACAH80_16235 [Alphaproteobacteria bacterium]